MEQIPDYGYATDEQAPIIDLPPKDDYDFLTPKQWDRVTALLERDLRLNKLGMLFVAPMYPEAGQEINVEFELELERMVWSSGQRRRTLAQAIMDDNCPSDQPEEVERAALSLENTAKVLRAALIRYSVK